MFSLRDNFWMQEAIVRAETARAQQEVPVGAVLIMNDELIGEGFNAPISCQDPTAHAEIVALRQGAKQQNNYRLPHSTLYVTLEPCLMCIGAIVHARVERLVFGAQDSKAQSGGVYQFLETHKLNHHVICQGGLLAEQCGEMLSEFFQARR
jgi:tRNA(adenine34) deaminase